MSAVFVVVHLAVQLGSLGLFPLAVVWAARTGGSRLASAVIGMAAIVVMMLAALFASSEFGHRLALQYGFTYTFSGVLMLYVLTLGGPVFGAGAVAITIAGRPAESAAPYLVAYIAAFMGWFVGITAAVWMIYQ